MGEYSVRAARIWKSGTNELVGWLPFIIGPGPNEGWQSILCCAFAGIDVHRKVPTAYDTPKDAMDAYDNAQTAQGEPLKRHFAAMGLRPEARDGLEKQSMIKIDPEENPFDG